MNFVEARLRERGGAVGRGAAASSRSPSTRRASTARSRPGAQVTVGVRPHDVDRRAGDDGAPLEVAIVEALGVESFAHGSRRGGRRSSRASRPAARA